MRTMIRCCGGRQHCHRRRQAQHSRHCKSFHLRVPLRCAPLHGDSSAARVTGVGERRMTKFDLPLISRWSEKKSPALAGAVGEENLHLFCSRQRARERLGILSKRHCIRLPAAPPARSAPWPLFQDRCWDLVLTEGGCVRPDPGRRAPGRAWRGAGSDGRAACTVTVAYGRAVSCRSPCCWPR
jgi:hypothetical protein